MGGSIRVPAAFCGLYGLKTTEGSMGTDFGSFPGEPGTPKYRRMVTAGPLARSIDDVELAWRALMSRWPDAMARMHTAKPALGQYRVAYLDEWTFGNDRMVVGRDMKARLATLVESLRAQGVAATNAQPEGFAALVPMHSLLAAYIAFERVPWILRQLLLREYRAGDTHRFDFSEAGERLSDMDPDKYDDILARRDALAGGLDAFFGNYDVLILPVTPGPAILHNPEHTPIVVDGSTIDYSDYFKYPLVFNVTGHPALTIPLGLDDAGLPLAVQVVGPKYSEPTLITFARLIAPLHQGYVRPLASPLAGSRPSTP
jgi:amidase